MDEDFDLGGFDEAYDISDFGDDQAFSMDDRAPVTTMFGGGDYVDTGAGGGDSIASILNPALGSGNRTNITNVGGDSNLVFDPTFAAALDISRGLDPTLNTGGTGGLAVPAALRPQIPGEFMTTPLGEADMVRPMFFSQGEKFLQQTLPEIVRSGPIARLARGIGSVFQEGIDFAKDATAGIKLPSLKDISEGFTNFMDRFRPRETDTNPMNMLEAAVRDEVPRVDYGTLPPSPFTFGSMPDMTLINARALPEQNLNTGIVSMDPAAAQNVNRNVAEAIEDLQLVPSEFQDVPTDLGSGIRIAPGSGADRFKFTTSTGADLPGVNPMSNVFDMIDARNLEKEVGRLTDAERNFLAGRTNRVGGISSVRQIQENANKIRQDAIEAYKNPNTRLSNNLTMHIERFKIRNR